MSKNGWILALFLLGGIVIGGFLGNLAQSVPYLEWLSFGYSFGMEQPFVLDLNILRLTFGVSIQINIASILGVVIAMLIYRKFLIITSNRMKNAG